MAPSPPAASPAPAFWYSGIACAAGDGRLSFPYNFTRVGEAGLMRLECQVCLSGSSGPGDFWMFLSALPEAGAEDGSGDGNIRSGVL